MCEIIETALAKEASFSLCSLYCYKLNTKLVRKIKPAYGTVDSSKIWRAIRLSKKNTRYP